MRSRSKQISSDGIRIFYARENQSKKEQIGKFNARNRSCFQERQIL